MAESEVTTSAGTRLVLGGRLRSLPLRSRQPARRRGRPM
jgi:hypothetical protein